MHRQPSLIDVITRCPEYLDRGADPHRLHAIRAATRCLDRIALGRIREGDLDTADALTDHADALAAVLRDAIPALVTARFAADSPLRRLP